MSAPSTDPALERLARIERRFTVLGRRVRRAVLIALAALSGWSVWLYAARPYELVAATRRGWLVARLVEVDGVPRGGLELGLDSPSGWSRGLFAVDPARWADGSSLVVAERQDGDLLVGVRADGEPRWELELDFAEGVSGYHPRPAGEVSPAEPLQVLRASLPPSNLLQWWWVRRRPSNPFAIRLPGIAPPADPSR